MNPPDIPLSSQGFTETSEAARLSVKGGRMSRKDSILRSSFHSAKLSRKSSTTRSIKIFADVKNLLGIRGSSHIRIPEGPESSQGYQTSYTGDFQASKTGYVEDSSSPQGLYAFKPDPEKDARSIVDQRRQQSFTQDPPPNEEETSREGAESPILYEYFPQPPAPVFLRDSRSVSVQYGTSDSTPASPDQAISNTPEKQPPPRIDKSLPEPPYHSFTAKKKMMVLVLVSLAGSLSPLSSIIYFPALNTIAADFHVSKELVLLTITAFMLVQGITPVLRMPFESVGRRPVLIGTLFVFSGASIGLVFSRRFFVHLILRAVQAGGSAALTAIGAAVIGDISTAEERGHFMGIFSAVLIASHFISPVIGGALAQFLGFRSIFWVIFIFAAAIMAFIILLLPETLRSIAGNGTVKLGLIHRPFWSIFKSRNTPFNPTRNGRSCRPSVAAFMKPFNCLRQKNLVASIVFGSIVYAVWTAVISTTTILFQEKYHLSTLLIGLVFLPSGTGSVLSFYLTGLIMNRDYRFVELYYRHEHNIDQNASLDPKSLPDFPIYRARLRSLWWIALIFIATTAGYGFSILSPSIAVPLVLQFFIAFSATAVLFLNGVLVADLYAGYPASVIAVTNLIRFSCGALAVGTVQLLFDRLGFGLTFLSLAMIVIAVMPILLIQWVFCSRRERGHLNWWGWSSKFKNFAL